MRIQAGAVFVNEDRNQAFDNFIALHAIAYDKQCAALKDWRAFALETEAGQQMGALLVKGQEAHIGIFPAFRGKWQTRKTMSALCELFDVKYTSVQFDTPRARAFLERHGWRCCGEKKHGWIYERK